MICRLPLILLCILLGLGAAAAQAPPPPPQAPSSQPTAPRAAKPSASDVRRALDVLKDDRRRSELIATLEAILAAQSALSQPAAPQPATTQAATTQPAAPAPDAAAPAAEPAAPPPTEPKLAIPLAPDSLGANLLVGVTELTNRTVDRLRDSALLTTGLPRLAGWTWTMVADPALRAMLLDAAWRLLLAFASGLAAMWAARRLIRRPRAALLARAVAILPPAETDAEAEAEASREDAIARAEDGQTEAPVEPAAMCAYTLWRRLPLALGCLALELLAVLAFLLGGQLITATPLGGTLLMQLVVLAPLHGFALWQVIGILGAAVTAPDARALRMIMVSDRTAAYLQRQLRLLAGLVIVGDAAARVGWLLGMSVAAHVLVERTALLIAHVGVGIIVIRQRHAVADWLRAGSGDGQIAPWRARLAPVWHWLALAGLLLLWLLLLLEDAGGPIQALGYLLGSAGVLVLARIVVAAGNRALDRLDLTAPHAGPGDGETPSGLHIWLRVALRTGVGAVTVIALFHVWGLPAVSWLFATELGRQILSGLGTIGITIAVAVAVWEVANVAIKRHIAHLTSADRPGRAARLRTLLPMLRMALLVSIVIMVGLTVLSQVGLNIAPLLAGAGVLGIAIGLGSQKLMQDLITGLFLLLENVMQVGDVVTLGGQTGVVEELSIRSIRLRAEDGSVHVIPFSAVTTVTNMTRDFGQAVIEARVAVTEDYERVAELLRQVFAAMRAEPLWETEITGDLDLMGLARMDDTSMVIKCRVRCGPFGRWRVLREFQRRMQQSFTANNVILPPSAAAPAPPR